MQTSAIPYEIRATLLQLEPSLDADWQEKLKAIFDPLDMALQNSIDQHILKPKDIVWKRSENIFEYNMTSSLAILKHTLSLERMRHIAKTLADSLEQLKEVKNSLEIADYLENAIEQIDKIEVDENFLQQKEKLLIRRTFLINAAKVIRRMSIDIPVGIRNLSVAQIKSFIVEVFIKQQLLGYWFKPLLSQHSDIMQHPIFRYYLIKEQKIRRFSVIKTSKFLYLVAPVLNVEQNPYSIRRFLLEERGALEHQIFLNNVVLDLTGSLENDTIASVKTLVEKMVTIQSQIHLDVMEIVENLEQVCTRKLIPLLTEPMHLVAKNADVVAQLQLKKIENILTAEFLVPIHQAVKNHLSHIEEFEYLYLNVHRLFSEILACYREFKEQPALMFNYYVQMFEFKILGFIKLLEKRREYNFVPLNMQEWEIMHERSQRPLKEIQQAVQNNLLDYREIKKYENQLKREMSNTSLLKRFSRNNKTGQDLVEAQKAVRQLKHQMFTQVITVPRQHQSQTVFLEFESMYDFHEKARHYAFPSGDNGLTRLPVILCLPENDQNFDIDAFNASIRFDLDYSVAAKAEKQCGDYNYSIG